MITKDNKWKSQINIKKEIYKITDIGYNKCYIGSTTEELSQRMARHRQNYKHFLNGGKGSHIRSYDLFNEYGIEKCKIELIEYYKCDTLQELRKREGEHIKNTECVNKYVASRTYKEYREDNKDRVQARDKTRWITYYQEHKEEIIAQKSEYREKHRDKVNEHVKAYRDKNREKVNEKAKEYREKNRDEINARKREKRKQQKEQQLISTRADTSV